MNDLPEIQENDDEHGSSYYAKSSEKPSWDWDSS